MIMGWMNRWMDKTDGRTDHVVARFVEGSTTQGNRRICFCRREKAEARDLAVWASPATLTAFSIACLRPAACQLYGHKSQRNTQKSRAEVPSMTRMRGGQDKLGGRTIVVYCVRSTRAK